MGVVNLQDKQDEIEKEVDTELVPQDTVAAFQDIIRPLQGTVSALQDTIRLLQDKEATPQDTIRFLQDKLAALQDLAAHPYLEE